MSWYWWVLITVVAFGLGMVSVLYFQRTHPPDRRHGDRREGERREGDRREGHLREGSSGATMPERRAAAP
jgi:hypothetical protein